MILGDQPVWLRGASCEGCINRLDRVRPITIRPTPTSQREVIDLPMILSWTIFQIPAEHPQFTVAMNVIPNSGIWSFTLLMN